MPKRFLPDKPFDPSDFPDDHPPGKKKPRRFPLVEVFGYDRHLLTPEARSAFAARHCPFMGRECEKHAQYGYGYCAVEYESETDSRPEVYAVCDHRLDGPPVARAVADYFGPGRSVTVVSEVKLTNPDQSFDYVAVDTTTNDFVVIETQAIDLRGGGVGPAWQSLVDGKPAKWRDYFTAEAKAKNRKKDGIDYGVNKANITKRLGFQVADKGPLVCGALGTKLYVVAQERCFDYFRNRIPATWTTDRNGEWDIAFVTFDYSGVMTADGQRELVYCDTRRTTLVSFSAALARSTATITRDAFLAKVFERVRRAQS